MQISICGVCLFFLLCSTRDQTQSLKHCKAYALLLSYIPCPILEKFFRQFQVIVSVYDYSMQTRCWKLQVVGPLLCFLRSPPWILITLYAVLGELFKTAGKRRMFDCWDWNMWALLDCNKIRKWRRQESVYHQHPILKAQFYCLSQSKYNSYGKLNLWIILTAIIKP